jgi:hypothetical protein
MLNSSRHVLRTTMVLAGFLLAAPQTGWACPVCFGDPNSAMSIGASWGILVMIGITGGVLAAFASFFLYLLKRSRMAIGQRVDLSPSSQARSHS